MEESEKEDIGTEGTVLFDADEDSKNDTFVDELYGDLGERQEMDYSELKELYDEYLKKVKDLTEENQSLKDQNVILKKNISSLYLTAREEIQRKDAQLKSLQDREVQRKQTYAKKFQNNQK